MGHLLKLCDGTVKWHAEIATRTQTIAGLLDNPEAARKQLLEWEAYTIRNLKLEKFTKQVM